MIKLILTTKDFTYTVELPSEFKDLHSADQEILFDQFRNTALELMKEAKNPHQIISGKPLKPNFKVPDGSTSG